MEFRKEVTDLLAGVKQKEQQRVSSAVMAVLSLSEAYRSYGSDFTFDVSKTLSDEVMKVMQTLSEGCLDDAEQMARRILSWLEWEEPDIEEAIEDMKEGDGAHSLLWAFDMHSSNLLAFIQAWLAIGFSKGLTQGEIYHYIIAGMGHPESSRYWRDAVRERLVDPNDIRYGRGYQRRIPDALTVLIQTTVWSLFTQASLEDAVGEGALYYVIHRGSTFDCDYCDSRCERLIPADEPYEPSHPRCMCWLEFIYTDEEAGDYR